MTQAAPTRRLYIRADDGSDVSLGTIDEAFGDALVKLARREGIQVDATVKMAATLTPRELDRWSRDVVESPDPADVVEIASATLSLSFVR